MDKLNRQRKESGRTGRMEISNKNAHRLASVLGNQASLQFRQPEANVNFGEVVQRERRNISFTKKETLSPGDLSDMYDQIQEQIDEISEEELPFIDMRKIARWQSQYAERKAQVDTSFAADEAISVEDITTGQGKNQYLRSVLITLSNLWKELNDSWKNFSETQAMIRQSEEERLGFIAAKQERKSASQSGKTMPEAKELFRIGQYLKEIEGAVAFIEDNVVVIVEHYQLKHNIGMGALAPGGPFKGSSGSQLPGGWDAHLKIYAPAIYQYVRDRLSELTGKISNKVRLTEIEAYISVSEKDGIYFVSYHGNPPDGE